MPRLRVVILDQDADDVRLLMWADVPPNRQSRYANAAAASVWADAIPADVTALQSGSMVEQTVHQRIPRGTPLPQIEAILQSRWTDYQTYINNYNPWQRNGTIWDGTTWTVTNNG